jgi:hypothetical protein
VPAVGPFDNPASWLFSADWANEGGLAAPPNVRPDAAGPSFLFGLLVVVTFVEADVLRPARPSGTTNGHRVEGLSDHMHVVDVGARESNGEGDSLAVYEDVALGSKLGAIGRIGPCEVPPFGDFTLALSRDAQSHSMPTLLS